MPTILIERGDGGVSILRTNVTGVLPLTQEVQKWRQSSGDTVAGWSLITEADIPTSRKFRACWKAANNKPTVHAPSARAQVLAELRAIRNARLAESDGERAKLEEIGTPEQREALRVYRQQLRDLPAVVQGEIENLTVEALEAYAPVIPAMPA